MATAVIYYSATGNCAIAAGALAAKLGASLIELKEKKRRNLGKVGPAFMAAGFQAAFKMKTRLAGEPWKDAEGYEELHIVMPIWAGRPAPAINTFLTKCDFTGKTVHLYTVQADPDDSAASVREILKYNIAEKGGQVASSHGLAGAAPGQPADEGLAQRVCALL